jgi:aldehyde dehydrogenase (NAD+)
VSSGILLTFYTENNYNPCNYTGEFMQEQALSYLKELGIDLPVTGRVVKTPIDGSIIGYFTEHSVKQTIEIINSAEIAFNAWRLVSAPRRGEIIRCFGNTLREHKERLGALVTLECGKIYQEGLGEVQEMIDICDFAVGLSRQLYGLTMPSERPGHVMRETWHPLGTIGVISAFNFPVAVWAWNFALAIVCGNSVVWKPSEKTPLTALACQKLFELTVKDFTDVPKNISQILLGGANIGAELSHNKKVRLVSATGSTRMGRAVAERVAWRLGKSLLELGGNNGMIVTEHADLNLAVRSIVFSAVGTAGQRCTTLRRLFLHKKIYAEVVTQLNKIYQSIQVGNPFDPSTLVGPLIDSDSFNNMQLSQAQSIREGASNIIGGNRIFEKEYPNAFYIRPSLIEIPIQTEIVMTETFAPILYVMAYENFDEAINLLNDTNYGLSASIITNNLKESEVFQREVISGILVINGGTSGAEIGGAFGGEKDTGGGRESGSDSWKAYMRRTTNTINYSDNLPLAQGIKFEV